MQKAGRNTQKGNFVSFNALNMTFLYSMPGFLNGSINTICQDLWFNSQRRVWPVK
jgi:hypothetical protein